MEDKIVYQGKSKKGTDFIIRYPVIEDAKALTDYINTLSDEKTFITYQGEKETLDGETKWLAGNLESIKDKTCVQLLVFAENHLVGASEITLQKRTSSHEGVFGITIAKEFRGEGIGKMLMQTIIGEAKKEMPELKMISLGVFGNNPLACDMYKGFGFKEYGRLPKGLKHKGNYVDHVYMYREV